MRSRPNQEADRAPPIGSPDEPVVVGIRQRRVHRLEGGGIEEQRAGGLNDGGPPARPPPGKRRSGQASTLCTPPPSVNRMEPTKKVTPTAEAPTSCAQPGNGPTRKQPEPSAKQRAIHRRLVMAGPASTPIGPF